jgi:hypothetical protein
MLVEFERAESREDEDGIPHPLQLSVNPNFVGSVIDHARQSGITVIRMCDGRGLLVRGTAAEVKAKIEAAVKSWKKGKGGGNDPLVLPAPSRAIPNTEIDREAQEVEEAGSAFI